MTVLSLKTELDVAKLLLAEGWFPEEINGILVFPLPGAAFHHVSSQKRQTSSSDVIKATTVTPTALHRARQLLRSAGWLDNELESLLKPCLYSYDPWANQTLGHPEVRGVYQRVPSANPLRWVEFPLPTMSLGQYRRTMALKRLVSLALVIMAVSTAVVILG